MGASSTDSGVYLQEKEVRLAGQPVAASEALALSPHASIFGVSVTETKERNGQIGERINTYN
jgi:hypothetical protein